MALPGGKTGEAPAGDDAVPTATGAALRREGAGPGELGQTGGWRDTGGTLTFAPRVM